jgi:hypothetical protein
LPLLTLTGFAAATVQYDLAGVLVSAVTWVEIVQFFEVMGCGFDVMFSKWMQGWVWI